MTQAHPQGGRRLSDLREILRYVPQLRDRTFVIAIDGAVVEDDNFRNVLLDLALLRSLRVGVVLVHGAAHQLSRLATQMGQTPSNIEGSGITDPNTLQLALLASGRVRLELLEGLSLADLRGSVTNAIVAHPAGILGGVDHGHTGRIERVDSEMLRNLLAMDMAPVVPPIGWDGEGNSFRLNSDIVAVELARALQATKLIYLTTRAGIELTAQKAREIFGPGHSQLRGAAKDQPILLRQLSQEEATLLGKKARPDLPADIQSKLDQALRAVQEGIPRVHIIDGRVEEGLLAEVFSNEGIGTLVYANEYTQVRRAQKKDIRTLINLTKASMAASELMKRTRAAIERQMGDYYLFEIDKNPVGCVALHLHPETQQGELAFLYVSPSHENQGIGSKLVQFVETRARELGLAEIFTLSTTAFTWFQNKAGYSEATPDVLPPARRERYEASGRNSKVLVKRLRG